MTTKDLQQEFISEVQQRIFDKWSQQGDFDQDWKPEDINWWKWLRFPRQMDDRPQDDRGKLLHGPLSPARWLGEWLRGSQITDRYNPEFTKFIERMRSSADSDDELIQMITGNIKDFPSTTGMKINNWLRLLDDVGGDRTASSSDIPEAFTETWYDLFEPLTSKGITTAERDARWRSFQAKYFPRDNRGRIKLPSGFSPSKGEDLEKDKIVIDHIRANSTEFLEILKQGFEDSIQGIPQATDEEIFKVMLQEGPSGLSESDISAISSGDLMSYLPELLMVGSLDSPVYGGTGDDTARFPEGTPSGISGDIGTDGRYNNSYRPGTADIPHVVTNRNGKETYYDENWQEVSPPREDVGPVEFKPDSRYFERDPVTGEWKLNEAVSNLPLGQQAQFDNRFKLAEEAMSNIQKGGQLGINYAAQDLKGREYLDDMLRDPGSSLMRMANFRGDPQWKGGPRFQGVSPANRFNDYQNYYGGLNEQLRNLYANQGLFNAPPATTSPAGPGPGATGPGGTGPTNPGLDIGAGDGFKPPEQTQVTPGGSAPGGGNFNVPGPPAPPASQVPGFEYPGNRPMPGFGMDPGSIRSQAIQPLIPSTANQNNNANQNSLVQNALRRLPIPTPIGPISTNQAAAGINAIQNIPTPPMPNMSIPNIPNINPVATIDPGFYKNIPMPNIDPGFGMPSIPNIDPGFGLGAAQQIGQKIPGMVTDIKETITDIDVPNFIDLPEISYSGPRFGMPKMPSFNMPNILDSSIVNTIQGQGDKNVQRAWAQAAAAARSRNTLANAQRGRRGSFG